MRNMKYLSVALIAIGLSSPVVATSIVTTNTKANGDVFVPNQNGGFKFGVETLSVAENSGNDQMDNIYSWETYATIGYLFPQTGNDLTVDYTYLRSDDTDANIDKFKFSNVFKKNTNACDLDIIDLEGGQRIISDAFDVRLFAGVRYTRLYNQFGLNTVTRESDTSQSFSTTFSGFGPRLGVDARYNLGYGFGLDAHLNTSLIVGKINSKYQSDNTIMQISSDVNRVVPEADTKIGFDCTHLLSSKDKSAVIFEIGYQSSNYFNVLDGSALNSAGNVSFNGAYLDIKYTS